MNLNTFQYLSKNGFQFLVVGFWIPLYYVLFTSGFQRIFATATGFWITCPDVSRPILEQLNSELGLTILHLLCSSKFQEI